MYGLFLATGDIFTRGAESSFPVKKSLPGMYSNIYDPRLLSGKTGKVVFVSSKLDFEGKFIRNYIMATLLH